MVTAPVEAPDTPMAVRGHHAVTNAARRYIEAPPRRTVPMQDELPVARARDPYAGGRLGTDGVVAWGGAAPRGDRWCRDLGPRVPVPVGHVLAQVVRGVPGIGRAHTPDVIG